MKSIREASTRTRGLRFQLVLRVAARLLRTVLVLLGVLLLVFSVVRAVPGDPAISILGEQAPPEELALLREEMGLDRPLPELCKDVTDRVERAYLDALLTRTKGRIGQTADSAGIQTRTLFEKMKRLGLQKQNYR